MPEFVEEVNVPAIDAMTRGVVLRERYIRGTYTRLINQLLRSEARLIAQIERRLDGLTGPDRSRFMRDDWSTARLVSLRESIQSLANQYRTTINTEVRLSAREVIAAEIELAVAVATQPDATIGAALSGSVSEYQLYTAALAQPFNGTLLKDYMRGVEQGIRRRVLESLRTSFANGETNSEAVRHIRGTRALNYTDGVTEISRRSARTIVRTTMTHMAARTHEAIYKDLGIDRVVFLATLDSRTTTGCAALDQSVYKIDGKRPSIPRHLNCRSAWLPYLGDDIQGRRPSENGPVSGATNFETWLKRQPEQFQRTWLGSTRYDLWKNGTPLKRFIDPQFKEYSAEQLLEQYRKAA